MTLTFVFEIITSFYYNYQYCILLCCHTLAYEPDRAPGVKKKINKKKKKVPTRLDLLEILEVFTLFCRVLMLNAFRVSRGMLLAYEQRRLWRTLAQNQTIDVFLTCLGCVWDMSQAWNLAYKRACGEPCVCLKRVRNMCCALLTSPFCIKAAHTSLVIYVLSSICLRRDSQVCCHTCLRWSLRLLHLPCRCSWIFRLIWSTYCGVMTRT